LALRVEGDPVSGVEVER